MSAGFSLFAPEKKKVNIHSEPVYLYSTLTVLAINFTPGDDFYSSNVPDLESEALEELLEGKCRTCPHQVEKFDVHLEGRFFPTILLSPCTYTSPVCTRKDSDRQDLPIRVAIKTHSFIMMSY
jgi:hypothetical protein